MEIFEWTNPYNGCLCHCGLRWHETSTRKIIIATELRDNPGTSITNSAEIVWPLICHRVGWMPQQVLKIEHYPDEDTYDIVANLNPVEWEHIDKGLLEHYIGVRL